jgi:undecaprenyl pyrophosphate phosphatase UppP
MHVSSGLTALLFSCMPVFILMFSALFLREKIYPSQMLGIAIGFGAAFLTALRVILAVVGFVGRYGFAAFAWYRIALGAVMLILIGLDIG